MEIKNILYLFLLTNIAVIPYIFTMEKPAKKAKMTHRPYKEIKEFFDLNLDIFEAIKVLPELESSEGSKLPGELIRIIIGIAKADRNGQALSNAIKNINIYKANQLLKKHYINVNMQDKYGDTALMEAIISIAKHHPLYHYFGFKFDWNPLMIPQWVTIVKILLQKGANPDLQDNNGNTALNIAVINNLPVIVKILLKKGANIKLQNSCGCTALDIATIFNYTEIVQMLNDAQENKSLNL